MKAWAGLALSLLMAQGNTEEAVQMSFPLLLQEVPK
jgi:hypothetical protein